MPAPDEPTVSQRVLGRSEMRVCIRPDYYGITYRDPRTQRLSGLDFEMAQALARELGVQLLTVDTTLAKVEADLLQDRCDVAMFALIVTPQRQQFLRFSRPHLEGGLFAVTTRSSAVVRQWSDIDRPGVAVAVSQGAARVDALAQLLRHARIVPVAPPQSRERELISGRVDVFIADFPETRRLRQEGEWARLLEPPSPWLVQPYAYAVKRGDDAWWAVLDRFVARVQSDGRLEAAARRHGLLPILRPK